MNTPDREDALTLQILEAIDERSDVTQRGLARRSGVALGLANSYLKRCVRKGLIKVQQAPANRYLYYLTPTGFAEKSRLTAEYLSYSFTFYRRAADSCSEALREARARGAARLGLFGVSELAEIVYLQASEHAVSVVDVIDRHRTGEKFRSHVVGEQPAARDGQVWILTALREPHGAFDELLASIPRENVIVPAILGLKH